MRMFLEKYHHEHRSDNGVWWEAKGAEAGSILDGDTMSSYAFIDLDHLARYTLGDKALEREILGLFKDQAPDYAENCRQAANAKAWRDATHTLKGSARAVGAFHVAEAAQRAENTDFALNQARAEALNDLERHLKEALRFISTFLETGDE